MTKKIRTGIVGFGMSARVFHAPFIHTLPEFEWVAVVERSKNEASKKYPYIETLRDIQSLISRNDIDLIVITTPNETHFSYAKLALEQGKHVVIEKPFTNTSAEANQLIEISHSSKSVFSVYQNRRYVGDFKTITEIIHQNLLGKVHEYTCHFDRYRDAPKPEKAWREEALPGSGVLFDLGPHLIDQALCLFGLPTTITAFIKKQRPFSVVDDYFDIRLEYENQELSVILKSGMLVREMGPRYSIHGHSGSFMKYGDDPQEELLKAGNLPDAENWGREPESQFGILHSNINGKIIRDKYPTLPGNYGDYYRNLYASITQQKEIREKPAHGFNTIKLIELAIESDQKKKTINCEGLMEDTYPRA